MIRTRGEYLGTTRDGYRVYDRTDSHLHFEGGITKNLVKRSMGFVYVNGVNFKKKVVHFREFIGYNNCISISEKDEVVKVYRKGWLGMTPMVKNANGKLAKVLLLLSVKIGNTKIVISLLHVLLEKIACVNLGMLLFERMRKRKRANNIGLPMYLFTILI